MLRAVVAAHTATITFESIDPFLGRGVRIDTPSLMAKLVRGGRGGYCFEQNLLFIDALRALGLNARPRLARVIRGQGDEAMTSRTHVMAWVTLPEGAFLADVGFGNMTPTAPLALDTNAAQTTPHERYRVTPAGDELILRAEIGGQWEALYRLGTEEPAPIDLEVGNWFTATHRGSPFTGNLVVARPAPGGRRTLFNTRLADRPVRGEPTFVAIDGADSLGTALRERFGLNVPAPDLAVLAGAAEARGQDSRFRRFFS
jgi:N-hydroxyarylamine O-acetyltransferase